MIIKRISFLIGLSLILLFIAGCSQSKKNIISGTVVSYFFGKNIKQLEVKLDNNKMVRVLIRPFTQIYDSYGNPLSYYQIRENNFIQVKYRALLFGYFHAETITIIDN